MIYALSIVLVYMVLAALYESWTSPAAVVLVVPIALVGVLLAQMSRGYDNNIYTQVGLVLMIALASKNAILIVEFARDLHLRDGLSITEAAVEATRRRFRPIVMTSFAFILGVVPLMVATGAGAASQQAIGTVVFGGMMASTLLAIPFVPVFFVALEGMSERMRKGRARRPAAHGEPGPPSLRRPPADRHARPRARCRSAISRPANLHLSLEQRSELGSQNGPSRPFAFASYPCASAAAR